MVTTGQAAKRAFFVFLVVGLAFGMVVPATAATSDDPITDYLNLAGTSAEDHPETVTNLYMNGTVTTSQQDLSEGTDHESIAGYEDDSGDWVENGDVEGGGDFEVNTTHDIDDGTNVNTYSFRPGHISDDSYSAFSTQNDTWTNASVWQVFTNSGNVTVKNTTAAADVDAVQFDSTSDQSSVNADGQVIFEARFNAWSSELDSDESKRYLQFAADVDTLDADVQLQVRVYDESGSYKNFTIDPDTTFQDSSPSVLGAGTNDYVKQVQLDDVTTEGPDSTWDNIENVTVRAVADGGATNTDVDVTISWLDLRKKSANKLGEQRATTDDDGNDNDGDGDYDEFQTVRNSTNEISVYSMETLDTEYDDATVNDLSYYATYDSSGLDEQGEEGNYIFSWEEASNPSYDDTLNMTVSLKAPSAIDLSYSDWSTRFEQKWPEQRYLLLETDTDVSDSTNLSAASFTSDLSSLGSQETTVTVDASTSAGERQVLHVKLQVAGDERANLEVSGADEGAAAAAEEQPGFWSDPVNWFWTGILGIVGWLGLRRFNIIGGG